MNALADRIRLRLFVAGSAGASGLARAHLDRALQSVGTARYELEIVDVLTHPGVAQAENVLVTPTLIRMRDHMRTIMIGDLGNLDRLRDFLAR